MSKKRSPKHQDAASSKDILNVDQFIDLKPAVTQAETQVKALEEKCIILSKALDEMTKKLKTKEEEILHLKFLLNSKVEGSGGVLDVKPPSEEELIIEAQIRMLKTGALQRELSLDEVKRFDLLMKNKKLIKEKNDKDPNADMKDITASFKDLTNEKLIEMAKEDQDGRE